MRLRRNCGASARASRKDARRFGVRWKVFCACAAKATGEDYVTLRNDRFVIPVRASEQRGVPGVVHGASATGQTVFVEPLEAIDLNNRLVQLSEEELVEISRILTELTERLRADRGPLDAAAAQIAHLDSVFARARFAREIDCVMPVFQAGNSLRLDSGAESCAGSQAAAAGAEGRAALAGVGRR